nr:hypothetical protein [bacterium]
MKQKLKIYGKGTSARRPASLFSKASGALILCMAALVIPGCVSTEEIGAMRYEINMLNTEVRNLKAATGDRSKDNATEQNLLEIKESQATSAKSAAELYVRIEELSSEFKILTGRFEEARYYSEKKAMEMVEDRDMLLARITKLQEQLSEMKERPTPIAAPVVPEASTKPSPKTIATLKPDSETEKVILP